jgi:hypothetical protein
VNVLGFHWITGICFGIEFPPDNQDEETRERGGPMPWVIVHLGIIRFYIIKYSMED